VPDLIERAQLILHVVPVFVRDHVRLHERSVLGAELRFQVVEEAQVDVDQLVLRAVEGAYLRAGVAAPRLNLICVEDGVRVRVLMVAALEDAVPELLHAVDDGDDPAVLPLVGILAGSALLCDLGRSVARSDARSVQRGELAAQRPAA
jgi:hypothetical protein